MGGYALGVPAARMTAQEYRDLAKMVHSGLCTLFPQVQFEISRNYINKPTYGDLDVIINTHELPSDWWDKVLKFFDPSRSTSGNGIHSFFWQQKQVDLITASPETYEFHVFHYSYGELSNIASQIAYKMGFKLGEEGLSKIVRNEDGTEKLGEVLVTANVGEALTFLGYDYERWLRGFYTLEEIFEYVTSTGLFHRQLFRLENHNAQTRKKLEKRPNYLKFIEWLESKPELDKWQWPWYDQATYAKERELDREEWLDFAVKRFPDLRAKINEVKARVARYDAYKAIWNGTKVMEITGLNGKDLGQFMHWCIFVGYKCELDHNDLHFTDWVMQGKPGRIDEFIKAAHKRYTENQQQSKG